MAASVDKNVELGFVEEVPSWRLLGHFFPSKIGGKPAWLNLEQIPGSIDLSCPCCGKTTVFLAQVYCPYDEDGEDATTTPELRAACFHRSIYIFCCRDPSCYKSTPDDSGGTRKPPLIVLRCQLKRSNKYYSYDPPNEEREDADVVSPQKFGVNLCGVCGCNAGDKKCGKCNAAWYCSKDHQLMDWRAGHKSACGKKQKDANKQSSSASFLFPEYELVTEPEPEGEECESAEGASSANLPAESCPGGSVVDEEVAGYSVKDLEAMARKETDDDKQFMIFKKRISREPEQVLRYHKGSEPLYVSASQQPIEADIPPCVCGAKRQFELQVMPQLLSHLGVDSLEESIDWGTLLVYTCSRSCDDGPAYHSEVLWKQDYHNSSI